MNNKGVMSPGLIILLVVLGLILLDLVILNLPFIPEIIKLTFKIINSILYFAFVNILFFTVWYYISRYAIRIYAWLRNMFIKWDAFVTKVFR